MSPITKPDDLPLDLLACPKCAGEFETESTSPSSAEEFSLRCQNCGTMFPVTRGVPRLTYPPGEEVYGSSFEYQWSEFALEQFDSSNGTSISEQRFINETGWAPEWLAGKRVFEVGCGAGRFLEIAARYADLVVGIDVGGAIDVAARNLSDRSNVVCVQASAFALPLRAGVFDGGYCIGVIQHTPDPQAAAAALCRPLKGGGRVAVTAYERKPWTKLNGKYLLRPLTRRLPPRLLLGIIRVLMPVLFVIAEIAFRIPYLNRLFRYVLPIADVTREPELTMRQRYKWAVLDTFDALSPTYDNPVTEQEIGRQLSVAGMVNVTRRPNPGLNLVAESPG